MERGFWDELPEKIIGLSPMDGVTDPAFRYITAKYGKPDVLMTEFVSVEGMNVGNPEKVFKPFLFNEIERPIAAQIFGHDIKAFYQATIMVGQMGFDGVDINMGCPAKKISSRGAGAGLIQIPEHAKEIVRAVQRGAKEFANGKTVEDLDLKETTKSFFS